MQKKSRTNEYIVRPDGREVCPECGWILSDFGPGHYNDCRYFLFEHETEDDVDASYLLTQLQLSLFRPAA